MDRKLTIFFFLLLLFCNYYAYDILFTRDHHKDCIFNITNVTNQGIHTNKGILYHAVRKSKSSNVKLCCSFNKMHVQVDLKKDLKENCCLFYGTKQAHKIHISVPRSCPHTSFYVSFSGKKNPIKILTDLNYTIYACENSSKTNHRAYFIPYKLSGVPAIGGWTDYSDPCLDPQKPFHIKFVVLPPMKVRLRKDYEHIYSWCCEKNIFGDFRLRPTDICCGLAGAQSPLHSLLYTMRERPISEGWILRGTPPCCRTLNGAEMCEPLIISNKRSIINSHICPAQSGIVNLTRNLSTSMPYYAPAYYAFGDSTDMEIALNTISYCTFLKAYPYFYSFRTALDRLELGMNEEYGLCCSKENAFALEPQEIADSCCIAFTTNLANSTPPVNLPCHPKIPYISQQGIIYKPCVKGACVKVTNNSYFLSTHNEYKIFYEVRRVNNKSLLYGLPYFWTEFFDKAYYNGNNHTWLYSANKYLLSSS